MDLGEQIKRSIGTLQYIALRKMLKRINISIDPVAKVLIIYRDGQEPLEICFDCLEDYVNNINKG
jgi:hypothetical protein